VTFPRASDVHSQLIGCYNDQPISATILDWDTDDGEPAIELQYMDTGVIFDPGELQRVTQNFSALLEEHIEGDHLTGSLMAQFIVENA